MSDAVDYRVTGRVRFANLMDIREAGEAAITAGGDDVVVDLSGIENGNSAAVALLIAWYRAAESQDKSIRFVAAPAELENIVELSGLRDVLPLTANGAERDALPAEAGE